MEDLSILKIINIIKKPIGGIDLISKWYLLLSSLFLFNPPILLSFLLYALILYFGCIILKSLPGAIFEKLYILGFAIGLLAPIYIGDYF